mmetsp:Transcript_15909/g.42820  ORF Transcript_15909/g.42820 Transcript_15909/m.42820 type:complete len:241 (+) Transcript_15909:727-1449(+)
MVVRVVGGAVHEPARPLPVGHSEVAVVDRDGPHVDGDEHADPEHLVHWEDKDSNVVGEALDKAVERVEGVRGEGRGHLPLVVGLVDVFVEEGEVEPPVEPIDEAVCEHEEHEDREEEVGQPIVAHVVIEAAVALQLPDGHDGHEHGHLRDGAQRELELQAHLPRDPLLILHPLAVKEEVEVSNRGKQVHDRTANGVDQIEVHHLAHSGVARHLVLPKQRVQGPVAGNVLRDVHGLSAAHE